MALQFDTTLRNTMLDSIETSVSAGGAGKVQIWTGSVPANCGAASTGTKLWEYTLGTDFMSNASAGSKAFNPVPLSAAAVATGTAGYFRIVNNSGTAIMQGTVATSGADLNLDNTSINSGQTVQITSWTITAPGA
jgi:hypothetical protein